MSGGGWARATVRLREPWRAVTTVRGGASLSDVSVWVMVDKPEILAGTGAWVTPTSEEGRDVESAWFSAADVVAIEWEAGT